MRSNIPDSAIPQIVQMISEGRDTWEIAVLCGVPKNGVRYIADKYNLFTEIQRVGRRVLKLRRRHAKSTRSDFNGRAT